MPTANEPTGRGSTRTAVVWSGLEPVLGHGLADGEGEARDVLDIGGGTGGFAVRVAAAGHRVTVVDPSPDALAALDRRAREHDVVVTGRQGDLSSLPGITSPKAERIIAERPYASAHQLVTRHVLTEDEYSQIQDRVVVTR